MGKSGFGCGLFLAGNYFWRGAEEFAREKGACSKVWSRRWYLRENAFGYTVHLVCW